MDPKFVIVHLGFGMWKPLAEVPQADLRVLGNVLCTWNPKVAC